MTRIPSIGSPVHRDGVAVADSVGQVICTAVSEWHADAIVECINFVMAQADAAAKAAGAVK